jgi:hypothetical protein
MKAIVSAAHQQLGWKGILTPLFVMWLFLSTMSVSATTTITLDLDSLPSAQGWTYESSGPLEANVYAVNGTKLLQNTMGTGATYADYAIPGIVNPNPPFTITVRARVLTSEVTRVASATAFTVWAYTGTEAFGIGLNTTTIHAPFQSGMLHAIDATRFHDYRIEAIPGVSVSIFVDNVLLISQAPPLNAAPNVLALGDSGSDENGRAEITSYTFIQGASGLGGTVTGVNARRVNCQNLSTGQTIVIRQRGNPSWNCEVKGLVVHPGDIIQQTVKGPAN